MKKNRLIFSLLLFVSGSTIFAQPVTVNFNYTGSVQTFTVPACVTSITVDAYGAQGGNFGGMGGRVQGVLPVNPGDVLNIYVGGQGGGQITNSPGGYNGGGNGGTANVQTYAGCGGGGASDIRYNGTALTDRVIVAGGGGGAHPVNGPGGLGGGLTGGGVTSNGNTCMGAWAMGGTQSAGGAPSVWSGTCCQFTAVPGGSLGVGGNGTGPGISCNNGDAGSGGGGGYYGGGGGGTYTAGAGGSSYTAVNVTGVIHTQGDHTGDGLITIVYNPCVGIDDQSALNATRFYPNPTTGMLNVNYPSWLNDVTLMVVDLQGRIVYSGSTIAVTTSLTQQVDLSALANGVYTVKISSANSVHNEKLVINK